MADEFASLKIAIEASLKDFSAKMGDFEKVLKGTEEAAKSQKSTFIDMAKGYLTAEAAMAAFKKTLDFVNSAVAEYDEALLTTLRLSKSLGEDGAKKIEAYSTAIVKGTRFSEDEIKVAAQKLTIHKLNREEIEKLIPVIMDYATKTGRDAVSTAQAFGRAIEFGTTRGLRPFGIEVNKDGSQLEIFNKIIESGSLPAVKGLAEEAGKIGAGGLVEMKNQLAEIKEQLGEKLLPIFQEVVTWMKDEGVPVLEKLIENFDDVAGTVKSFGEGLLIYFAVSKIGGIATSIGTLSGAVKALNVAVASNPVGAIAAITAATYIALQGLEEARKKQKAINDAEEAALVARGAVVTSSLTGKTTRYGTASTPLSPADYAKMAEMANAGGPVKTKAEVEADAKAAADAAAAAEAKALEASKLSDKRRKDAAEQAKREAEAWKNFKDLAGEALKEYQKSIELTMRESDSAFKQNKMTVDEWYKSSQAYIAAAGDEEVRVLTELMEKTTDVTEKEKFRLQIRESMLDTEQKQLKLTEDYNKKLDEQARAEAQVASILSASKAGVAKSKAGIGGIDPITALKNSQEAENAAIQSDYEKKLADAVKYNATKEQLDQIEADRKAALRNKELADEKAIADAKLSIASQTAGNLASIFQNLYEMNGSKNEAMFNLWKASAIAQAVINTYSSATAAYASMAGIPVVGPVLGGIAAAAAVTAGLLNVQKITETKLEKKAEGGMIFGKSHAEGGAVIEAEGGEFVQRKSAVRKYGLRAMEAINRGLVSPRVLNNAIAPSSAAGARATASPAAGSNKFTIVNFIDNAAFKRFLATPDGKQAMQNHISENSFHIKQALGTT